MVGLHHGTRFICAKPLAGLRAFNFSAMETYIGATAGSWKTSPFELLLILRRGFCLPRIVLNSAADQDRGEAGDRTVQGHTMSVGHKG